MPATLTKENETKLLDMIKDVVGPEVKELIESHMAPFREKMTDWEARLALPAPVADPVADPVVVDPVAPKGGEMLTRMIQSIAIGKGDPHRAASWYKHQWADDTVCKALAATDATAGGFIVPEEMAAEIIELLRPASVIMRMNPQIVSMDSGVLRLPRITAGASATYIAENSNMTATEPTFGQVVASAKKLAALVPVSNDLIRRRNASTSIVRDDLVAALAEKSDSAFIRSDGTAGEPKGLRYWAPAANLLTVNASVVTENVIGDLGNMVVQLMNNDTRMLRVGWLMAPRTWNALMTMTTSQGGMVLRDEMQAGRLFGFPFAVTTNIPINLAVTGTAESELYLVDFADVVVAESTSLVLDASTEAAYHDGSNVVAAFSLDQLVVRAIMEHDLVVRHEESICVSTDVDWNPGITT